MAFDLSQYETVESRLEKFIADYPDFRIDTVMESFKDDRFIVRARGDQSDRIRSC